MARSDEVVADGNPLRLMALGEPLIAFRDTSGRLGVLDHRCPHRCASLFFGRNEQDGIRCIYHGWKFDVDGNCLEMANVPPHQDFKHKIKAKAYKTTERYGVIWLYMGDRAEAPPFPDFELNDLQPDDISVRIIQQEYNWLQGLENDLDTSHFGFLHLGGVDPATMVPGDTLTYLASDRTPQFHIEDTPLGLMYGAYRPADAANTHWRLAQFIVPFWVIPPAAMLAEPDHDEGLHPDGRHPHPGHHDQPRDHGHGCGPGLRSGEPVPGLGTSADAGIEYLPNTTDWFGRWRLVNNAGNDYLIDREAQRHGGVFSGIFGLTVQDNAVGGMLGPISDRTLENLTPSDAMIARARHKLVRLVEAFAKDKSTKLPGVDDPGVYRGHRAGNFVAPNGKPFREAYEEQMRRHANAAPRWAAE